MKTAARGLVILLVALGFPVSAGVLLAAPAQAKVWAVPQVDGSVDPLASSDEYANRVMAKINRIRERKDLKPVRVYQACLDHHSNRWARHLAAIGELVHRDQDKVLADCDLHWTGETLVLGTGLRPAAAVVAWMHSPPHRAVIMKPRARLAGVGMKVGPAGVVYCALNFGDAT